MELPTNVNLFKQALLPTEAIELDKIKKNKAFVMRLLHDLENYYHIYKREVKDDLKSTTIWLYPNGSRVCNSRFMADANRVVFETKVLVYRTLETNTNMTPEWCFGAMYDRYKDVEGTSAEKGFIDNNHGCVSFYVPITTENINDTLRDVMRLLEKDGYKRVL